MKLPINILPYFEGLLSAPWKYNLVYISIFCNRSHDFLTRSIKRKYSWKEFLYTLINPSILSGGYLIVDETDIDKTYSKKIEGLSWIFSHRKSKHIFGYYVLLICWSNGNITIPLGWKIYNKRSKEKKITRTDLAIQLISFCIYRLRIRPKGIIFDSFYSSQKILKFLDREKIKYYSQLAKNRNLDGKQLRYHELGRPYWVKTGEIKGKLKVQVVKNRKKYFVTNDIGIPRKEQLDTYKLRWKIEEIFRFTKQSLGLEKCQSVSQGSQHNHFGVCFSLFGILQVLPEKTQVGLYRIKLKATLDSHYVNSLNLSSFFDTA